MTFDLRHQDTIAGLRRVTDDHRNYVFKIVLRDLSQTVGTCGLTFKHDDNSYEVGYWLHREHCGTGLMTECVRRLVSFARDDLKAERLTLIADKENIGSQKVAEKVGFSLVRIEEEVFQLRPDWGKRVEHHYQLVL